MSAENLSGLDLAKSKYNLVDPISASETLWNTYTAERSAVQKEFGTVLSDKKMLDEDGTYDTLVMAISDAVHKMEEQLGLPQDSLLSGISILYQNSESSFEDENDPGTVKLLTRIYSVSSPSSVDLHLTYHHRMRLHSIEWYVGIGYKINTRPSPKTLPTSSNVFRQVSLLHSDFSFGMYTAKGWNTFYQASYDDEVGFSGRHWKQCEVKKVGLSADGLRDVHDELLGSHPCMDDETAQNSDVYLTHQRLVQTAQLLLACVGVDCSIATKDSEEDALPSKWKSSSGINWILEGIPRWFAREVRKAAGFQLERDAQEAEKHAEAVKDELRGESESDDDDDDDDETGSDKMSEDNF